MTDWIAEAGLSWRALQPFGAEVALDLSAPLKPAQAELLVDLLWHHGLLLARGQSLSMERQRELCALAGPILIRPGENGYLSTDTAVEASLSELRWHADAAYTQSPFDAISLHAVDVVDEASSTCFVNTEAGLASLPPPLRERLQGREVEMISPSYEAIALRSCDRRDPIAQKLGILPTIYRNPHNGRDCLWLSELQAARILGMDWEDSRALLHEVFEHLYQPAHIFEHRWRNGDLLIWDNIALQHMRGSLKAVGKRRLQRVIVGREGVAPHIPIAAEAAA